jgi:hypothetical protein
VSYIRDLDEYYEEELEAELASRAELRIRGLCDYCKRPQGLDPACKFSGRHCGRLERPSFPAQVKAEE